MLEARGIRPAVAGDRATPCICFVAPKAIGLLAGDAASVAYGGAEVQQVLLARALQRQGWSASFVVFPAGDAAPAEAQGFRLFPVAANGAGRAGVRFVHPRWTSLTAAMAAARADVYYQRGNGAETGQAALWCRLHRRPFVFAAASDSNTAPKLPDLKGMHERWLYRLGLRLADLVVCQTAVQQRALQQNFGRAAELLPSIGPVEHDERPAAPRDPQRRLRVLWVGRFAPKKRPEWVLELARTCGDIEFHVVGELESTDGAAFALQARRHHNVVLQGRVPYGEVGRHYDAADVCLCTSRTEGFPNTFLEAWSRGRPVVTTFDPDDVVQKKDVGLVGRSLSTIAGALCRLRDDPQLRAALGRRARTVFREQHAPEAVGAAFAHLLSDLRRKENHVTR